jgi:threonine 3-dehydrogenase
MRAIQMVRPEAGAVSFVEDAPVPVPGVGEVLIRVAATAICGTDRHIYHWDDSISRLVKPPTTIGHEFCGNIVGLGEGVSGWHENEYVSAEMHIVCGHCRACLRGEFHICENTSIAGLQRPGCFAEYVVVPASNLVRLDPQIVPPHIGAFLDALGNAVHTIQATRGIAGRHVLLSGNGAIGAMAAAVVQFQGAASLTISEVAPGHLARARAWAASVDSETPIHILDPTSDDNFPEQVRDLTGGGVDVVLEMSGAIPAINVGLDVLYPGGEMIMLGIPNCRDLKIEEFTERVIFKGLNLQGVVGRRMFSTWDLMLEMLANGLALDHIVTHQLPLEGFEHGIQLLDKGEAHKVVLDPQVQ